MKYKWNNTEGRIPYGIQICDGEQGFKFEKNFYQVTYTMIILLLIIDLYAVISKSVRYVMKSERAN